MKPASLALIFDSSRQNILLILRRDLPIWVLPGGGIETGESPEQTAVREVFEETGVHVTISKKLSVCTPINRLSSTTYLFECTIEKGIPSPQEESRAAQFFPVTNLPLSLFFIHRDWIEQAVMDKLLPIQKITQATYFNGIRFLLKHPILTLRYLLSRIGIPINQ